MFGRAVERILRLPLHYDHQYEVLCLFADSLPEEDWLVFSGASAHTTNFVRAAEDYEYWTALKDIYRRMEDPRVHSVALWPDGQAIEVVDGKLVETSFEFTITDFMTVAHATGFKVPGTTPRAIQDGERGLRIVYSYGGYKTRKESCLIIRRDNKF